MEHIKASLLQTKKWHEYLKQIANGTSMLSSDVMNLETCTSYDSDTPDKMESILHMIYYGIEFAYEKEYTFKRNVLVATEEEDSPLGIFLHLRGRMKCNNLHFCIEPTEGAYHTIKPQQILVLAEPHLDLNEVGKLIIWRPSDSAGGEAILQHNGEERQVNFSQSSKIGGLAFFGNNVPRFQEVISGSQHVVEYPIFFGGQFQSDAINYQVTETSYVSFMQMDDSRKWWIRALQLWTCSKAAKSFGLLFSHDTGIDICALQGVHRVLAYAMKNVGCALQMTYVLLQRRVCDDADAMFLHSCTEDPPGFSGWGKMSFYVIGTKGEPVHSFKDFEFHNDNSHQMDIRYTTSDEFWLLSCLAVKPAGPWCVLTLLWIGHKKNTSSECPFAKLPSPIIKIISEFVMNE